MKNDFLHNASRRMGLFTLILLTFTTAAADNTANGNSPAELIRRVTSFDAALFDAFNRCQLEKLETYFIPTLEFYHDNDGLTASREKFIADVKKNVCGKFRRELVAGTLEVWPLGDYGAVYSGTHRFCKFGAGTCEGTGRFMHILKNNGDGWKVTRVISYDHKALPLK